MTKSIKDPKVQKIVQSIIKKFDPEKIILFGSYAWGKPGPDSDVDLLVIKETNSPRDLAQKIDLALLKRNIALDLLVYTPAQIKRRIGMKDLFVQDVLNNGITLYAKS